MSGGVVDPQTGLKTTPRPVLGDDLAARDHRRAVDENIGKLMALGISAGDAIKALADADGDYTAALASVATPPPAPVEPPASPVDTRALAASIRNGTMDRDANTDIRDMAREIRGHR